MFRALLITTALTAASASAQAVDVAPITFDVEGEEALVVAAVAAPTGPSIPGAAPSPIVPAAARVTGDRPQPSIILGLIEPGQEASFGVESLLRSTVEEVLFDIDDLAAREALRESDPELFRQLVEEGYLDVAEGEALARQLQVELARMNCYTSDIDGLWGPGSRGSVSRYFEEVGVARSDLAATNDLLRTILITGDRECPDDTPAPVASGGSNSGSSSSSGTRTQTTRTQSQPARTQTQPTRTEPTGSPRLTIGGSGVFR
ncbi:MAG: hypothetical protein AAGH70_05585 [Pseudomonadota bacterium]